LAQAQSNEAPRGRKSDYVDALRLARRFVAAELKLSYVPDEEQRGWRCLARSKYQLSGQRVRLHGQMEALLEESRIKLSSLVSDLLGATGRRILGALAKGETDREKLAALAANNVKASRKELADALRGPMQPAQRKVLGMLLEQVELLDRQTMELRLELG
jgi:transposase